MDPVRQQCALAMTSDYIVFNEGEHQPRARESGAVGILLWE